MTSALTVESHLTFSRTSPPELLFWLMRASVTAAPSPCVLPVALCYLSLLQAGGLEQIGLGHWFPQLLWQSVCWCDRNTTFRDSGASFPKYFTIPFIQHNTSELIVHTNTYVQMRDASYPFLFSLICLLKPRTHMHTALRSYKYDILGDPPWMDQRRGWVKVTEAKTFEPKDEMKCLTPTFAHRDLRAAGCPIC